MDSRHEPDPSFIDHLEWQVGRELRRRSRRVGLSPRLRTARTVGLMVGSVALGAATMGVSQQLQDSWRKELVEARLSAQVQLTEQRLEMLRGAAESSRRQLGLGMIGEREVAQIELQLAQTDKISHVGDTFGQTELDGQVVLLQLEEVRRSGREPLSELSAPLVAGRDFVSEKKNVQRELVRRHLDVAQAEAARMRRRAALGTAGELDVQPLDLAVAELEFQLQAYDRRLVIRRAYLASEISAAEAELQGLEVEAENRLVLLDRRGELLQLQMAQVESRVAVGIMSQLDATPMRTQISEHEAQRRLAEAELQILRRELERRRAER